MTDLVEELHFAASEMRALDRKTAIDMEMLTNFSADAIAHLYDKTADRIETLEAEITRLREALEAQTLLVDRLCSAVDQAGEDIGHESIDDLLKLIGPANEHCIELLGGRAALGNQPRVRMCLPREGK